MNSRLAPLPAAALRSGRAGVLARLEARLIAAWDGFAARREYRRSLEQLHQLDARQLADIGLTRDEAAHLTRTARIRRPI